MKAERLVFKNTLTLGIGKAVGDVAIFFFLIYFSRAFGRETLGQYAFAMSTGGVLAIFVSLGLNTFTIRELSKDSRRAPEFVGRLLILRLACAVLCFGLLSLIALLTANRPVTRQILLIVGSYHLIDKLTAMINAGFMAHEEMVYPTLLGILERALILLGGAFGIYCSLTPAAILAAYPASGAVVFAVSFLIFQKRHGRPDLRLDYPFMKTAVRQASPFLVIMVLAQFYDRIGIIILTFLKGENIAGIYMAADRLLSTMNGFSEVFAAALFPSVTRLSASSKVDLERLCDWAARMVFIFLFPIACLLYILSDTFILFFFGSEFSASAAVLRIAGWSLVLFAFNRVLSIALIAFYRQGQLVRIRIVVYICYLCVSVGLVWQFGHTGMAWSKMIAELVLFLSTLFCAAKLGLFTVTLKRFVFPTAICLLFVFGFTSTGAGVLSATLLFSVVFAVTACAFRIVQLDDLRALRVWLVSKGRSSSH